MTPNDFPSELLASYLSGEADGAQRRAVEDWAAEAPANAEELRRMRALWDLGGHAVDVPEVNVDAAWARLENRIADAEGTGRVRSIGARTWTRWLSAAAMVALLVLAARWFFQPASTTYLARAQPEQFLLADSSRTVLFPGSKLKETMGKQRAIRLQGRAYFEVRRDEQRPFTVDAGDLRVTVLGTAFEVADYDTAAYATVRVRTGHVRVVAGADTMDLLAGDHLRYDKHLRPAGDQGDKYLQPGRRWLLRVRIMVSWSAMRSRRPAVFAEAPEGLFRPVPRTGWPCNGIRCARPCATPFRVA